MSLGLYIHVPFCLKKCRHCSFYSEPISCLESPDLQDRFIRALGYELDHIHNGFAPSTVYVGGGTPTSLDNGQMVSLLELIQSHIDLEKVEEWTFEANPCSLSIEKLNILRDGGVNRISLGLQSFDQANLAFLGRSHSSQDSEDAVHLLRERGFDNISLDLIYGIPGSFLSKLEKDLERIVSLAPEHISCYCLTFEKGTPLKDDQMRGIIDEIDEEEALAQYDLIRAFMKANNYSHYEISNFARNDKECKHNLLYWEGGTYIGCGPGAHSHFNGVRYGNPADLQSYIKVMADGRLIREYEEKLEPEAKACEGLVMHLRKVEGISRKRFVEDTGFDYMDLRGAEINGFLEKGFLIEEQGCLRLAEKALFVSDSIFAELV